MFGIKSKNTPSQRRARTMGNRVSRALGRYWRIIFVSFLVMLIGVLTAITLYLWYTYARMQDVSQQETDNYIAEKQAETAFREEEFNTLKETVEKRRSDFDNTPQFYDNMFHY